MRSFFILVSLLFLFGKVMAQRSHLLVDFNDSLINKHFSKEVYESSELSFSDSIMRKGNKSIRAEVNLTDSIVNNGIRAEFAGKPETYPERWYALSIYAPSGYLPDAEPEIVTQWHNVPDFRLGEGWLSPSMSLFVEKGRWNFHVLWDTAAVTKQGKWMGSLQQDLGTVRLNAWTAWVFHIRFSYKADGLVEIYQNSNKIYTRRGPNLFNDEKLPYWKFGLYKWVYKDHDPTHHQYNQRVLFYSSIREGDEKATYKDVAP